MGYIEEIDNALAAHALWKRQLKAAIDEGKSEFTVSQLQADYFCDFGKWLYGLPNDVRATHYWVIIQKLHAEFHLEAANILKLAHNKRTKSEALLLLAPGGKYTALSEQMVTAMTRWKRSLQDSAV